MCKYVDRDNLVTIHNLAYISFVSKATRGVEVAQLLGHCVVPDILGKPTPGTLGYVLDIHIYIHIY